jgi:hypothetical protein
MYYSNSEKIKARYNQLNKRDHVKTLTVKKSLTLLFTEFNKVLGITGPVWAFWLGVLSILATTTALTLLLR